MVSVYFLHGIIVDMFTTMVSGGATNINTLPGGESIISKSQTHTCGVWDKLDLLFTSIPWLLSWLCLVLPALLVQHAEKQHHPIRPFAAKETPLNEVLRRVWCVWLCLWTLSGLKEAPQVRADHSAMMLQSATDTCLTESANVHPIWKLLGDAHCLKACFSLNGFTYRGFWWCPKKNRWDEKPPYVWLCADPTTSVMQWYNMSPKTHGLATRKIPIWLVGQGHPSDKY